MSPGDKMESNSSGVEKEVTDIPQTTYAQRRKRAPSRRRNKRAMKAHFKPQSINHHRPTVVFILLTIFMHEHVLAKRDEDQCLTCRYKTIEQPQCQSEIFVEKVTTFVNETNLCCYQELGNQRYAYINQNFTFNCSDVRSLKEFTVNDMQYLLITDRGKKGQGATVRLIRFDEDQREFSTVQTLHIKDVYSSNIVQHRGQILLMVSVFSGQECGRCQNAKRKPRRKSRVYIWNHSTERFDQRAIQRLPAARRIHWFLDKYNNVKTVILVIGHCNCPTQLFFWDRSTNQFHQLEFHQTDMHAAMKGDYDITVQSVRQARTQHILLGTLAKQQQFRIWVYRWLPNQGLVYHTNVTVPVFLSEHEGLSVLQHKGQVFMCSKSTLKMLEGQVEFYKLLLDNSVSQSKAVQTEGETGEGPSFCELFVHPENQELYAAVGYGRDGTKLFRYNLLKDRFINAGKLSEDIWVRDVVHFQRGDDIFAVLSCATEHKCTVYGIE
ncbi:uncharacterized protein LOC110984627 isoform X2 [Acanthaster planci]|uniref:Uncharacterized protein LOC110984627 isoform X2 n=1 Tax=Acanthaster planci TaxID=133434 RepID=A0A8B7Z6V7_ACAPL|nr:uncharacterized protein LOC110984627 isoform X2 [Acanthaster planci]